MIAISKTLPVGTATMERSFSAMNRILSWAHNSLDSLLASDFMLLSMNKDLLKRLTQFDPPILISDIYDGKIKY